MTTFLVFRKPGVSWLSDLGTRSQPLWDEHAAFMDRLFDQGIVVLGGSLADVPGAVVVCEADSADTLHNTLAEDPWVAKGILERGEVHEWTIFLDARSRDS
jgi:uncharacterized protein YciI